MICKHCGRDFLPTKDDICPFCHTYNGPNDDELSVNSLDIVEIDLGEDLVNTYEDSEELTLGDGLPDLSEEEKDILDGMPDIDEDVIDFSK